MPRQIEEIVKEYDAVKNEITNIVVKFATDHPSINSPLVTRGLKLRELEMELERANKLDE